MVSLTVASLGRQPFVCYRASSRSADPYLERIWSISTGPGLELCMEISTNDTEMRPFYDMIQTTCPGRSRLLQEAGANRQSLWSYPLHSLSMRVLSLWPFSPIRTLLSDYIHPQMPCYSCEILMYTRSFFQELDHLVLVK